MAQKTNPTSFQGQMNTPLNPPASATAQALAATQGLISNPGAAAQVLLNNAGINQPLLSNPGSNQPLLSNPGVNQPLLSNPGVNQPLQSNPGANQPLHSNPSANQPLLSNTGGQQLTSNPGAARQPVSYMSNPLGNNQGFLTKPSNALALVKNPSASHALIRSDRGGMLGMSDDNVMLKQILTTHAPDGREVDVRPLLYLVEDILNRATQHVDYLIKV